MLGSLNDVIWFSGVAAALFLVARSLFRREFFRYFPLNAYMLGLALVSIGRRFVLEGYGLASGEYLYFYYYSDTVLTIFLYFAILNLYEHAFVEMKASRYIRGGGIMLLSLTAGVSYMMVHQNAGNMTGRFVIELSQNLYFVGVVLTYVLWGAVVQLRETRLRLVQLVLALGIFFSAHAAVYAARQLFPGADVGLRVVLPLLGVALPLSWAYTFTRVPEEARLETARVAPSRVAASHQ